MLERLLPWRKLSERRYEVNGKILNLKRLNDKKTKKKRLGTHPPKT